MVVSNNDSSIVTMISLFFFRFWRQKDRSGTPLILISKTSAHSFVVSGAFQKSPPHFGAGGYYSLVSVSFSLETTTTPTTLVVIMKVAYCRNARIFPWQQVHFRLPCLYLVGMKSFAARDLLQVRKIRDASEIPATPSCFRRRKKQANECVELPDPKKSLGEDTQYAQLTLRHTVRHIYLNKILPSHSYRCYFRRAKLQDWSNGEESSIPSKEPITSITSHSHNFILGTTKKSINQSFDASLLVALYTNKQTNKHARNHHYYTY